MDIQKARAILMVLYNTGEFSKSFLRTKRDLSESEINYLIDEGYIIFCGFNTVREELYCVSQKGNAFWRY